MGIGAFLTGAGIGAGNIANGWIKNEQELDLKSQIMALEEARDRRAAEFRQGLNRDQNEWEYNTNKKRLADEEKDPLSEAGMKRRKREAEQRGLLAKESEENLRLGSGEVTLPNGDKAWQQEDGTVIVTDKDNKVAKGTYKSVEDFERSTMSVEERQKLTKGDASIRKENAQAESAEAVAEWTRGGRGKTGSSTTKLDPIDAKKYAEADATIKAINKLKLEGDGTLQPHQEKALWDAQSQQAKIVARHNGLSIDQAKQDLIASGFDSKQSAAYDALVGERGAAEKLKAETKNNKPQAGIVAPSKSNAPDKKSDEAPRNPSVSKDKSASGSKSGKTELQAIEDEIVSVAKQLDADNNVKDVVDKHGNKRNGGFRMSFAERKRLEDKLDALWKRKADMKRK